MIIASEIFKKYETDIKNLIAKEKLLRGYEPSLSLITAIKAMEKYNAGVLDYLDDISDRRSKVEEVVTCLKSANRLYRVTYKLSRLVFTNLEKYESTDLGEIVGTDNVKELILASGTSELGRVIGTDNIRELKLTPNSIDDWLILKNMPNARLCIVGSEKPLSENFISIDLSRYAIRSCFNNQYFSHVILKGNNIDGASQFSNVSEIFSLDCFNNCIIDNLVLDFERPLSSVMEFTSCFKFTCAKNISINCDSVEANHIKNRLTYMRGVYSV